MTGGGARILAVGEATLGSPFVVQVSAIMNADIDVSAIYVCNCEPLSMQK